MSPAPKVQVFRDAANCPAVNVKKGASVCELGVGASAISVIKVSGSTRLVLCVGVAVLELRRQEARAHYQE